MNAAEVQYQVVAEHLFGDVDEGDIRAHRVAVLVGGPVLWRFTRHAGAVAPERILHIGVDGCAVALRLPVSRHLYLVPAAYVIVVALKARRPLLGVAAPMEQPLAVETHYLLALFPFRGQLQRSVIGQFVDAQHMRVLPVGCCLCLSGHRQRGHQ